MHSILNALIRYLPNQTFLDIFRGGFTVVLFLNLVRKLGTSSLRCYLFIYSFCLFQIKSFTFFYGCNIIKNRFSFSLNSNLYNLVEIYGFIEKYKSQNNTHYL